EGTLFGAYELLEQLGVRWFMPGELGTVVPRSKTVSLPVQQIVQAPSFTGRWHMGYRTTPWAKHMRMGGPYFPGAHGIRGLTKEVFAAHPEYFALVNGKRQLSQACVSNPHVVQMAVEEARKFFRANPTVPWLGFGPNDGAGFCQCENCRALDGGDWDP